MGSNPNLLRTLRFARRNIEAYHFLAEVWSAHSVRLPLLVERGRPAAVPSPWMSGRTRPRRIQRKRRPALTPRMHGFVTARNRAEEIITPVAERTMRRGVLTFKNQFFGKRQ